MSINYEKELNPAQLDAVMHGTGPALVVAGAGSGKTRTLVYRVARLVESGVEPSSILLLTFTRRAAEEMLSRAAELLDSRCASVEGGTFHSMANKVLRMYGAEISIPSDFTILDRADSEDIISWARKDLELNRRELRFPRKSTLMGLFSQAVNRREDLEAVVERQSSHLKRFLGDMKRVATIYKEHKKKNALLDYDDLLEFFLELLRSVEWVRLALNTRYTHVLVDEFQDTNPSQSETVMYLAGGEQNVVVVGDDSQSIYSFRGARFKNIIDFPVRFPHARIIKLEQNYRSTQPVLDAANRIISEAREKYTKCLYTIRTEGSPPVIWSAENEHHQSVLVANEIEHLLEGDYRPDDIAVLFRGSHHSFDLEVELTNRGLSFVKYGGIKFLEAAHIKDVISHLRLLANPLDFYSWQRVFLLLDGVGLKRATQAIQYIKESGEGYRALTSIPKMGSLPGIKALAELFEDVSRIRGNPRQQLERVCAYYNPMLTEKYDDHPKRTRHLDELMSLAERFSRLRDFLAEVTLEPPQSDEHFLGPGSALTLSTIHSAKGLEWKAVFVIWVAEQWFPHSLVGEDSEEMEEERRLLYVAATRAEERLYFSYPRIWYKPGEGLMDVHASRFLRSLDRGAPADRTRDRMRPAPKRTDRLPSQRVVSEGSGKRANSSLTGKRIRHRTFGMGTVIAEQGEDKIVAHFNEKGLVTLKLAYAPIEVLD